MIRLISIAITFASAALAQTSVIGPYVEDNGATISIRNRNVAIGATVLAAKCDGVTDMTASLQAQITALHTAGGGTLAISGKCVVLGQLVLPYGAAPTYSMNPIRLTGTASSRSFSDHSPATLPGTASVLDLRYAGNRIQSFGQGTLEIDHLTVTNGGSSCGTFLYTTLTTVLLHDNSFWGAASGTSACDDVWIGGGTNAANGVFAMTVDQYFQGYSSYVKDNFSDYIRRLVFGQVAFNSVTIENNTIGSHSGSNLTTTISAGTNASPAVLTSTGHGFPIGSTVGLTISGFTGNWMPLNGAQTATIVDANTFSIAVNSTAFGAVTGTPAYLSGAAIEINGDAKLAGGQSGNVISKNLIEMFYYPYAVKLTTAAKNTIVANACWDTPGHTVPIACYRFDADSPTNLSQVAYSLGLKQVIDAAGSNALLFVDVENGGGRIGFGTASPTHFADFKQNATTDAYIGVKSPGSTSGLFYGVDLAGAGYYWMVDNKPLYIGTNNGIAITVGADKSVTVPAIKSTTGTRYVCVDTAGKLVSSASACSGS